jgi:hypothetical protein
MYQACSAVNSEGENIVANFKLLFAVSLGCVMASHSPVTGNPSDA